MILSRDGKRQHNWANRRDETVIDKDIDNAAALFIGGCNHLTPARERALDRLIGVGTKETEGEPDEDILHSMNEWDDWEGHGPTPADLQAIAWGD